jgi:hypothetical protein
VGSALKEDPAATTDRAPAAAEARAVEAQAAITRAKAVRAATVTKAAQALAVVVAKAALALAVTTGRLRVPEAKSLSTMLVAKDCSRWRQRNALQVTALGLGAHKVTSS